MKKIFCILILPILLFYSCSGYTPIFSTSNLNFKIIEHSIEGNKEIGNLIYSKLNNLTKGKKEDPTTKTIKIIINSSKNKKATSKNSAGKILEYKIIGKVNLKVLDYYTNDTILNQDFISSLSYKVTSQYSQTADQERKAFEDIINKIYQDLLIQVSRSIAEK